MAQEQQDLFFVYNTPPVDRIPNKEKLTPDEVARCLSCSRSHVYNLIAEGSLEASSISRRMMKHPVSRREKKPLYRVYTASLRKFLDENREGMH